MRLGEGVDGYLNWSLRERAGRVPSFILLVG